MSKAKKVSAWDVAEKIAALECSDAQAEFGPKILEIMLGVPRDVFVELDEKPRQVRIHEGLPGDGKERFYMLRRVRNDFELGRKLFAGLV